MVVSPGYSNSNKMLGMVPTYDLKNANNSCSNWRVYPLSPPGSVGFLDFHGKPVICGGWNTNEQSTCFSFAKSNIWNSYYNMKHPRSYAAVTSSNWFSKTQTFLVSGGNSSFGNTAEILTETGWSLVPKPMPYYVHYHCSVMLNSTTVFVIGGLVNGTISNTVLLFDLVAMAWSFGQPLNNARQSHSCGKIIQGNDYVIIVVGGDNNGMMMSVEIFNPINNSWSYGPSLPYGIAAAGLAEDTMGGVILVGGRSNNNNNRDYMNTMIQLRNANPGIIETY